jgi:hypothetical protein
VIDEQEIIDVEAAYAEAGTLTAVANSMGKPISWVRRRLVKANAAVITELSDNIVGLTASKVTYKADADGNMKPFWVSTTRQTEALETTLAAYERALSKAIRPVKAVPPPLTSLTPKLLNFVPIGDLHLGMLAWAKETNDADWDMAIGQSIYQKTMAQMIGSLPDAHTVVIAPMGDFLHFDGYRAETPTSKHGLDTDTRFPKMVTAALELIRYAVNLALLKHAHVHLMIELGNHDPVTTTWLRAAFNLLYEKEPRVSVDTSPSYFHYYRFGKVLIGTTHGHTTKMASLPLLMAHDQPLHWGETVYRFWWTGHVHHDQAKDYPGAKCESIRVMPPLDAYAANAGYRSYRDLKGITYHQDLGEVLRTTVNVDMFG